MHKFVYPVILPADPVTDMEAATKHYVDTVAQGGGGGGSTGNYVDVTGDTMTGPLILSGNPTAALGAATKQYVDTRIVPMQTRNTVTKTTASLAADAQESGTAVLAPGYRLYRIQTSAPARVRLYTTTAKRDADLTRPVGTYPAAATDHGLQFEYITVTGSLVADLAPTVDGFDGKATPDGQIPYIVTNLSGITAAIVVTLTWLKQE